jgi:hypothetical protein
MLSCHEAAKTRVAGTHAEQLLESRSCFTETLHALQKSIELAVGKPCD